MPGSAAWESRYDLIYQDLSDERLFSAQAQADARLVGPVSFSVASALPLVQRQADTWLASNLNVGSGSGPLSYMASYSLTPGDIIFADDIEYANLNKPQRFGGQHIGQNVRLQLPALAGAPLAIAVTHESDDFWTVNGYTQQQREIADLSWKPRHAMVNLQWAGASSGLDSSLALDCELRGSVGVPTPSRANRKRAVRISGRDCQVVSDDVRYSDLAAQTYGVAYTWARPQLENAVKLSAIDPMWGGGSMQPDIDPSYELGLSQTRTRGAWTAKALVAVRHAATGASIELVDGDTMGMPMADSDTYFASNATITRRLPTVSVSATWAHGADPLWFVPEIGQEADRFGLAVDFTRWAQTLAPGVNPTLAMSWNWTQAKTRANQRTSDNALKLNLSVLW
ncbi:hypothetical protein RM530_06690 [Algiphilus sp. W345]|uniref:Uncharacterized protein n=1 Tax=Banduia mediterranea TaxID=3075609 RepID=A0ABU2WHP6_9GAMM|nr:hypothetical protein [Algiphilus sp. W345]MDT0497053.1 hypothetical protein [Algiphilus sp. W345]